MNLNRHLTNLANDLENFRAGKTDRLSLRETARATHVLVRGRAVMLVEAQMASNGVFLADDGSPAITHSSPAQH